MFERFLQDLGLSEKEAALYLSLLAVDYASVSDLSYKTKIKRPTVYVVLQTLEKKGLVSETRVGGRDVRYHAEPPERLEMYIEQQKAILENKKGLLKDYISQIKSLQRESGERPVVRFFEGKEGVLESTREMFEREDSSGGSVYMIYSQDSVSKKFTPEELEPLRQSRISKNIKGKTLYTSSAGERAVDGTSDRVMLDQSKYPIKGDITIYKDNVRIAILGKTIAGIMIKSEDVAETLRSLFNAVFDSAIEKRKRDK